MAEFARAITLLLAVALAQASPNPSGAQPQPPPVQPAAPATRPPAPPTQPPAPPTQPPAQRPPRFRGATNLVRVDVFATKDGVPVQDLTAADFEVSEDDAPQTIDSFEHVVIEPAGPQVERIEPASATAANQLAADPHRRVFVIFLDIEHVDKIGSHSMKEPLIEFMTRAIGADDLVGVMTPEMSPSQITFARKTQVIEEGLRTNWAWGRRDSVMPDEREMLYEECFPPAGAGDTGPSQLVKQMTARRRERMVLDSLHDLTRYMAGLREGRTAVITVTDGWLLYTPDPSMTIPRTDDRGRNTDPLPGTPPPVGVGPGGTLVQRPAARGFGPVDRTECDKERYELANLDDDSYFRNLFGEANRANVSFYTIDPRGLAASDEFTLPPGPKPSWAPIGADPPLPIDRDLRNLRIRQDSQRMLAANTDGLAMLDSNDVRKQMRRIADDLTSYYLLGYYSTNAKLDGSFRAIRVRSARPGLEIRARHGYRAATQGEVDAARAAADAPVPEAKAALARALGAIEPDARAYGPATVRREGEPALFHRGPSTGNQMQSAPGRVFARSDRIRVELEAAPDAGLWTGALLDRNGMKTVVPVAVGERTDAAGGRRWLTADVTLAPLGPGDYVIELTAAGGTGRTRTLVGIRVTR